MAHITSKIIAINGNLPESLIINIVHVKPIIAQMIVPNLSFHDTKSLQNEGNLVREISMFPKNVRLRETQINATFSQKVNLPPLGMIKRQVMGPIKSFVIFHR